MFRRQLSWFSHIARWNQQPQNKESVEDITNDIMDIAIFIRNEKTNVFVSGLTVRNDRLNDKGKNVNSLLKRRCDEEKICFVDNMNINVGMLNNRGLHLNEHETTRLANNFCLSLARWRYVICLDTVVTKKDDFNNPTNVANTLKPSSSSRKTTDTPSVDEISKKGYLGSNAKKLDSKRNFLTFQSVQAHRCKNPKNIIIGRLNVISLRNKLVAVDELRKNKIDARLISETKADESFLNQQFKLNGYKMFRKDRHRFGGGLIFYVNEQIPIKILSLEAIPMDIELLLLEFTVKNQRCLCVGIYRPPSQNQ